jgi:hypothetical protein
MKFDEMNAEQLEARLAELTEETSAEKRDALDNDELEARINEIEAISPEPKWQLSPRIGGRFYDYH